MEKQEYLEVDEEAEEKEEKEDKEQEKEYGGVGRGGNILPKPNSSSHQAYLCRALCCMFN